MQEIKFTKMHGLGNDFIVVDLRLQNISLDKELIKQMSDRNTAIGCDQLITLDDSHKADIKMKIYNSDGSIAEACGNATRCVAKLIAEEKNVKKVTIEFNELVSECLLLQDLVSCNMGKPSTDWQKIPLAEDIDTHNINFPQFSLYGGVAINIGNPHIVFFIDDTSQLNIEEIGQKIENNPLFPKKINVSFAYVNIDKLIELSVWERGAGRTYACGTAACATAVAAQIKGLIDNQANIQFKYGKLLINLLENGSVEMTGPATKTFNGIFYND